MAFLVSIVVYHTKSETPLKNDIWWIRYGPSEYYIYWDFYTFFLHSIYGIFSSDFSSTLMPLYQSRIRVLRLVKGPLFLLFYKCVRWNIDGITKRTKTSKWWIRFILSQSVIESYFRGTTDGTQGSNSEC